MPQWQDELDSLLTTLHVRLDDSFVTDEVPAPPRPRYAPDPGDSLARELALRAEPDEPPPPDNDEVSAVRSEIEATLGRVLALARVGRMDRDLRDDVIFVLRALTRPHPSAGADLLCASDAEARDEWQLASAAAVLRFCRIVLRLTNALAADPEAS